MFEVELQHITKYFGTVRANDDVTFGVRKGEIHAIVGENGAGKSTLMKILYGMHRPDAGRVLMRGREENIASPSVAMRLGVGMVHQHFMLVPPLTVAENVVLGSEPCGRFGVLRLQSAVEEIRRLSEIFRLHADPGAAVESVSVGTQQRLEILKLLYRKAEILILDEPTALLTPQEIEDLFGILRNFKSQQKTVILITHKLQEVMAVSDRVTVMRRGKVVGEVETASTSLRELARMMMGKDVESRPPAREAPLADVVLSVDHLSILNDRDFSAVSDVSIAVHAGEIIGIAAVEGNGQEELLQAIAGLRQPAGGTIELRDGGSPMKQRAGRIAHIPEDRIRTGIVPELSLRENFILGRHREDEFSSRLALRLREIERYTRDKIREYDIRHASDRSPIRTLSGGNQQKVVVARELSKNVRLILSSHPTRGLDIGAQEFVHASLLHARAAGKAILLISADLSELISLSDRIAVMFKGRIVAVLEATETSERELGLYMTGAS